MSPHDASYKRLFSHPRMVEDLLRGFVHEDWIEQIDFTTLETVKDSFVSDDQRARHDDIIWKARWRDSELYIFLLLEFQSTPDPFMAVRLLVYVGLLYQHLIDSGQYRSKDKLPPVLPMVIYNGERRWRAPSEMRELIADVPPSLEKYLPHMQAVILDEGAFPLTDLSAMRNLVAALFRLENSRTGKDKEQVIANLRQVLSCLVDWLREPDQASLRRDFVVWLHGVLLPAARAREAPIPELTELQEMNNMLYETVQSWYREAEIKGMAIGESRGMAIGESKGIAIGKAEGKADLLLKLLELKFGAMDERTRRRVYSLDSAALEICAQRLLHADSVQETLGELTLH